MTKKTQSLAFANLVASVLFIVLGIWGITQMLNLQTVKDTYAQPNVFPIAMIVGMLIFSVILFIQSILKLSKMDVNDPNVDKAESINFIKDKGVQGALIVIALCVAFVLLFRPLGYVLDAAIIGFIIMALIGKRNWAVMILVSILVPFIMWLLFFKLLSVNIPMGPLTFLKDLIARI